MKDLNITDSLMTKEDVTTLILLSKKKLGLSWAEIAAKIDMSAVFTHSACMGMNAFPPEKAAALTEALGLPDEATAVLAESPTKIWEQTVPTDPCMYRFYEIVGVYAPTLKALIHEEFGDGIMSAIDFEMSVARVKHDKGDRVKIEMSGKYLAYNAW
ncbi:cyanase [uncultured Tateyamaria sp.]|uniref:cyanase n=1 Tax=uncultured Tateyamaria sp. TaxID=455651 RepID=UPI00263203D7|nr:cyanase [uncultured Tateyamaria sp.]